MSKKTMLWIKSWNATTTYLLGNAGFLMVIKMFNWRGRTCEAQNLEPGVIYLIRLYLTSLGLDSRPLEPIDRMLIGPTQSETSADEKNTSRFECIPTMTRCYCICLGINLHPRNSTWNLKRGPQKSKFLLETIIFRFHVKFRGSNLHFLSACILELGYMQPLAWHPRSCHVIVWPNTVWKLLPKSSGWTRIIQTEL